MASDEKFTFYIMLFKKYNYLCNRNRRFGNSRFDNKHIQDMRFYDREEEMRMLCEIGKRSLQTAQFTVLTGRRRIGKTMLVRTAYADAPLLYFFVARKAEGELAQSYMEQIEQMLGIPQVGTVNKFADVFRYVMQLAKRQPITVMIDEFQEFLKVNKSVFSEMQEIWDTNKAEAKINLIVCGSVNSLMNKLFRDKKEPLYGRQTQTIKLQAFMPSVLKQIMEEYRPNYSQEDLLTLYMLTGGVPKYVEMLVDRDALSHEEILNTVFERDSYFLDEGKNSLIEEFGRDYGIYFSILSLIAQGHNSRSDIEGILQTEIGGYLTKLMDDYGLIAKQQPMFEESKNRNVRYVLRDQFLCFWFRFIYKYNYMLEVGAHKKLLEIVQRDYTTYSGHVLEEWFRQSMKESGLYTNIGYWHDRRGENEIDIIAADETKRRVDFFEVKRQSKEIDLNILEQRMNTFLTSTGKMSKYKKNMRGLSMQDM